MTGARSVKPLKPKLLASTPLASNPPADLPPPAAGPTAIHRPEPGVRPASSPKPEVPAPPTPAPPLTRLGRRLRQRVGRGASPIERRLDLHGLRQGEAHDALARFLWAAPQEGAKTVLVITGKGARADRDPFVERGVLRRLVPQWLGQPEFRAFVLGFEPAGVGHGGEGALYVRLRRAKRATK